MKIVAMLVVCLVVVVSMHAQEKKWTIVIDGNDGTGKSTLVQELKKRGLCVRDRGLPTKMTDRPDAFVNEPNTLYIILDVPVEVSRARLEKAGRDLTEKYHTVPDLIHYRARFLEVAQTIPNCFIVDACGTEQEVLQRVLELLQKTYVQR